MDYSIIKPQEGYLAIKEEKEDSKTSGLKKAGMSESNAYAKVIALGDNSKFELNQMVVYNEYEGQELMKYGKVTEDNILIIKEENIIAKIL